ncbi:hypothetical protein [Nakamurella sp. PAMC28650]|uniref:hypothetical protein n=1 Tax=Nakamurella sp. PAMC28650 TaxID=2762325 RepID=UPI00164DEF4C|nr:hypothetical protein [Nakamurella sp. PAMC28650]QNK82886.1 hypothetical protein H7F38_09565 [Nakamurella sp. PAMC28650]
MTASHRLERGPGSSGRIGPPDRMAAPLRHQWLLAVPAVLRFAVALLLFATAAAVFRLLRPQDQPGPALVAGWTVVTCAVLWLLRGPLERMADRLRFGGNSSYHSMRMLLRQLAVALPVDEVVPRLAESLGRSTHSARTEVRIALDGNDRWTQVWPPAAPLPTEPLTMQIRHLGAAVGEVVVDNDVGVGPDRRRLEQLTGTAGLAMSTVKQTWELRRRVADLQLVNEQLRTSQVRLRAVRSIEQARLQAEVDARVIPAVRTAAATVSRLAAAPAGTPLPPAALAALTEASTALAGALDTLRSIARGIFPPRLDEDGLPASLRSWADLAGEPVVFDVVGNPDRLHAAREWETCLYFCIVTLLRAAAPAPGSGRRVELRFEPDAVGFTVDLPVDVPVDVTVDPPVDVAVDPPVDPPVDRTVGLAPAGTVPGPVLLAVNDRLEAFDGRLHTSSSTGGVVIRGWLPMGSVPAPDQAAASAG